MESEVLLMARCRGHVRHPKRVKEGVQQAWRIWDVHDMGGCEDVNADFHGGDTKTMEATDSGATTGDEAVSSKDADTDFHGAARRVTKMVRAST
jgi:hypothetical protein